VSVEVSDAGSLVAPPELSDLSSPRLESPVDEVLLVESLEELAGDVEASDIEVDDGAEVVEVAEVDVELADLESDEEPDSADAWVVACVGTKVTEVAVVGAQADEVLPTSPIVEDPGAMP
jgi:hypothetical protein